MIEQDDNICPKCGKRNTYWNGGSRTSTITKLRLFIVECHDCGIEYEATTADEFNEEYLKEVSSDRYYSKKGIKGSRDGYWEPKS